MVSLFYLELLSCIALRCYVLFPLTTVSYVASYFLRFVPVAFFSLRPSMDQISCFTLFDFYFRWRASGIVHFWMR